MLKFYKDLSSIRLPKGRNIFIVDKKILNQVAPLKAHGLLYPVQAGEGLKAIEKLPHHFSKILKLTTDESRSQITIIGVGGGSVGDFAGFIASTLKRGVRLIHIPTTWLSAIDSAHGGKTALNVNHIKNQVGTFYPAQTTMLVKSILFHQPAKRSQEAASELIKIAMVSGKPWTQSALKTEKYSSEILWKFLPHAIQAKLDIVEKDPNEKKGYRQLLNLGHTMGHVFESALSLPHGLAVAEGLRFSLFYSYKKKILSPGKYESFKNLPAIKKLPHLSQKLSQPHLIKTLLMQDKKVTHSGRINFVFVSDIGKVLCREVEISEIQSIYRDYESI